MGDKEPDQTQQQRSQEIKYFKCLGHGHIASQCPNKRVMVMKGDKIESQKDEQTGSEEEGDICLPVKGDLLIQDVVLKQENVVPNQQTNLFYIHSLVQGKTCLTVIDSCSCANVIYAGLVSNLGLQVKQHPRPYALQWLNHQGVVHVHKHVQVPISIGDYTNELLCDVVPMNATHLILGRP